jgi:Zn ribbon nucleic-acid-binding protein
MTIGIGPDWEEIANLHCPKRGHSAQRDPEWVRERKLKNFRCTKCGHRGARVIRSHRPKEKADPGKVVPWKDPKRSGA